MEKRLASIGDIANKEFDFVIIGGGTAGCVLASRLSEDPRVSVAVLEAAPPHLDDPVIKDPMGWMKQMLNPEYDWMYWTNEQRQVRDEDQKFLFPRGRSLGGTSTINFQIWNLPPQAEVNAYERLGNPGWNWSMFRQYAKKVEQFTPTKMNHTPDFQDLYDPDVVGHDGPVTISFVPTGCGLEGAWQKALENHGVPTLTDSINGHVTGSLKALTTVNPASGTRVDAYTAYLLPALHRPNLKVLTEASVHRIITTDSADGLIAEAVEFLHQGQIYTVSARKEVLVTAGCIKSPQVLELSGIGDPKILQPLGIPVKVNLPGVGANVQEHVTVTFGLYQLTEEANRSYIHSGMLQDKDFNAKLFKEHPGLETPWKLMMNSLAFVPLQIASDKADVLVNKLKEKIKKNVDSYPPGLKEQYDIQLQLLEDKQSADFETFVFPFEFPGPFPEPKPFCSFLPQLMRPFSRGTIHVGSADPKEDPIIDPHYLEEEIDLEILVEGYKFVRRITDSEPLNSLVAHEVFPGRDDVPSDSDEKLGAMIRKSLWSSWHTCGSNSMLPRDKNGVVDSNLKVYGTTNIRVCDLSVVPLMPAVHTQGTVYTFAEIAADRIKAAHALK